MIIDVASCSCTEEEKGQQGKDGGAGDGNGSTLAGLTEADADAHKLEVENHERARQREIAAYLEAASFPDGLPWGPQPKPYINADPTLNALVQLGALRLNTDRSFLSFIDRETQWVVAEMTRSHSIREWKCDGDDRVWLGVARLEACWGVCPTTMKAFLDEKGEWERHGPNVIANRTRYIVNDFRTDPAYSERIYVKEFPYFVSYLEVPLVSRLGYLLGSYCVVDNKLHDFDNDETVGIMNDIAATIVDHLDNVRMRQNLHRSEKLLQGLSAFIGSDPSPAPSVTGSMSTGTEIRPQSAITFTPSLRTTSSKQSSSNGRAESSIEGRPPPPANQLSSSSIESKVSGQSLLGNDMPVTDSPVTSVGDEVSENPMERQAPAGQGQGAEDTAADKPTDQRSQELVPAHLPASLKLPESHASGFISSANIKSAFFRAATTIRRTMNMDGLLFLDAVPSTFLNHADRLALESSPPKFQDETSGPFCAEIVQSTAEDTPTSTQASHARLPEALLQRFIRRYPRGHIFSADEFGPIDEVYAPGKPWPGLDLRDPENVMLQKDVATVFQAFPAAKYIIFLPLWHFQRECWYAAAFGWVADVRQSFDDNSIGLVAAFGNSVMAEVSRMEALAASRAKTSFVSSISHELRSPLHGILASSELLREAITDPSLLSTLDMLDSCGKTLLDTFTNLLDHAIAIKDGKAATTSVASIKVAHIGRLVEDVVDAVHFSHLSEHATQSSLRSTGVYSINISNGVKKAIPSDRSLLVIINISALPEWEMPVDVGAWKRIVMNIYGNSLKYTKSGRIEVGLKVVQKADKTGHVCDHICFTVEDTGKGMSSDYLKYRLFSPFSQEDSYAPGIGLGLSIVQQLTTGLGGTINVKSSVGVGTLVEVCLPLRRNGEPVIEGPVSLSAHIDQDNLAGRTLCLLTPEAYAAAAKTPLTITKEMRLRATVVERMVRVNATDSLRMNVVLGTGECPLPSADLYLVDSDIVAMVVRSGGPSTLISTPAPLILVCSGAGPPSCLKYEALKSHGLHLHHPIGPTKMLSFFNSTLTQAMSATDPEASESATQEPTPTQEKPVPVSSEEDSEENDVLTSMDMKPVRRPKIRSTFSVQDIRPKVPDHKSQPTSPPTSQPTSPQPTDIQPLPPADLPVAPSTMTVTVPNPLQAGKPPESTKAPDPKPVIDTPPTLHLLLVDDNPINIKLLSAVAKKLNHTFESAANGLEAVELYQASLSPGSKRFQTVFMDISMPVMDGFEAIREIRRLEAEAGILPAATGCASVPEEMRTPCKIIALTGLSSELSRKEAIASGSDLFMTKPVKLAAVKSALS
ncbi:putative signal transduction histidine-protein kinase [Rhypophila decipiens]|uniref:histidine kinase n=1 Tax=Rhypophila decipiens TaxID=261697 RepID=A0AAN6Y3G0_9PEZI|nr:putative signal transduction histidine-protein kinase [Rhypophila decipiens]